ncbi:YqaJ-like viral recombinase domain [Popillia japonica]|uniref:YqaJ-like viral recombinase domain n=1 Tax=Popillia japonica TaxID=7064 RepID=A0AAW1KHW7_POPJA
MEKIYFSIVDYFSYLEGNLNSRRIYEGEEVLNAGHIILCGQLEFNDDNLIIYGLCLQSSAVQGDPHIIKGVLGVTERKAVVKNISCTCKGGNSSRCKHISALLLKLTSIGRRQFKNDDLMILIYNCCQSTIMMELYNYKVELKDCCEKTDEQQMNMKLLFVPVNQKKNGIKKESIGLQYGIRNEKVARECFKSLTGCNVIEFGFIISCFNNWMGFSPDGVIFEENKPVALLEIKCPYAGSSQTVRDIISELPYLKKENGIYSLKENHTYYAQIQVGMLLCYIFLL